MKKLDTKVNIIPVIAKADTITKAELQKFKAKVVTDFKQSCYVFCETHILLDNVFSCHLKVAGSSRNLVIASNVTWKRLDEHLPDNYCLAQLWAR